jgi:hypothetical protein
MTPRHRPDKIHSWEKSGLVAASRSTPQRSLQTLHPHVRSCRGLPQPRAVAEGRLVGAAAGATVAPELRSDELPLQGTCLRVRTRGLLGCSMSLPSVPVY